MFYSPSTKGFYILEIHGESMPSDVVEITNEHHAELLTMQAQGKIIQPDVDGNPIALDPPELTIEQLFEAVRANLQFAIDSKARELGFSGGNALMLYVGFENAFQPVAQIFAAWESSVWVQAGIYRDQVIAGAAPMLTPEEAVAQMPELVMQS